MKGNIEGKCRKKQFQGCQSFRYGKRKTIKKTQRMEGEINQEKKKKKAIHHTAKFVIVLARNK